MTAIATTMAKIGAQNLVQQTLKDVLDILTASEKINTSDQAQVLTEIAQAYYELEEPKQAHTYLHQALIKAESIRNSEQLKRISIIYAEWEMWRKAYSSLRYCEANDKITALSQILISWNKPKVVGN